MRPCVLMSNHAIRGFPLNPGVKTTVGVAATAALAILGLTAAAVVAPAAPAGGVLFASAPPADTPSTAPSFPPLPEGVVPILYLHRVAAPPPDYPSWSKLRQATFIDYDVLPTAFAAQLDWLVGHGYTTILPRDLAAHWDRGASLPPRPVIITFDDGSPSWTSTILPLLKARHLVAEFYLTLTAIARHYITWPEVRQLAQAGMGIGAHDVHHVQLAMVGPTTPPASTAVMWKEVHDVRMIIGEKVGTPPDSMAYVGGGFNAELVALVRRAGYSTARSLLRGIDQSESSRFLLRVVRIGPYDDVSNVMTGQLVPGLPGFTRLIAGGK
jgi:peptidoglycan/xylan/chitin deacetylase (PgdA/CDA1 family)